MAHSHLPTWKAAQATGDTFDKGNFRTGGVGSAQRSRKDATGYTKLKLRQAEQLETDASLEDLERRELAAVKSDVLRVADAEKDMDTGAGVREKRIISEGKDGGGGAKEKRKEEEEEGDEDDDLAQFDDKDDEVSSASEDENGADDNDDDDDDDSDSDSDDEEELARELERIKKERQEEAARKQAEEEEISAKARRQEAMLSDSASIASGATASTTLKRRWDADVVFQNQARGEQAPKKRFINDTLRNDFHRAFLKKYIP
ncbi:Protein CWC15-like [Hondaea fermentalgiana]|uniref:Protein CWC15-like n=1 Tax=Hondaea fermentalgiana TaxID=2315210 RepID=A0A2R5GTP4_9STRA|nr:Protein CWC15-like [Hondaea fermentalgiana]|eukprot:GBG34236.1 Protein CWC15-like [Hondaea fermentalgiana]